MRKTLIALILVIPMVFMLVIFSSVNLVSLGVNISANGINVAAEGLDEEGTLLIDMADKVKHVVSAEVMPSNATDKRYTLASTDPSIAEVTEEGEILPHREGTVEIVATSHDKGFTDRLPVVILSSLPYDFTFSISDGETSVPVEEREGDLYAQLPAGTYQYNVEIAPIGFTDYEIRKENNTYAEMAKENRSLYLPFSGETVFGISVPNGVNGAIEKRVNLQVLRGEGEVLINGEPDFSGIELAYGTTETQFYLECDGNFSEFRSEHARLAQQPANLKNGRYILDVEIDEGIEEGFPATIVAGGKSIRFMFTFAEFDFSVFSELPAEQTEDGRQSVTLLTGNAATFYAVASTGAKGVAYTWNFDGPEEYLTIEDNRATVTAIKGGSYILTVTADYLDKSITKEVVLSIVNKISAIQIVNNVNVDLAERFTVGGKAYTDSLTLTDNAYQLRVYAYSTAGTVPAGEDVEYVSDREDVATVEIREGKIFLIPHATGEVTVTAQWKGNRSFGLNVAATLTFNVVQEAVSVKNAPELNKAADDKLPIVLMEDIKLGTDANGNDFSLTEREEVLRSHRMRSTYNIEWYKNTKDPVTADSMNISYVMEFSNDVYGNGKSIDANNFTQAHDANGKPLLELYKGPLYFVKYGQMASVAGQDNCAFLIRTDGVKLYGVNLLGCSDSSLLSSNAEYNLSRLNLTGTTLEINANAEIVNCRIRNGRNVVRAYGGNRDGDHYFLDDLSQNRGCDEERINVRIEGCILSQGREFVLKIGANRAFRASGKNGIEPQLTDSSGKPYPEQGKTNRYGDLYQDPYFYSQYVMTDVTLKDSVVESSGLFTIGIESNFAGTMLYEGQEGNTQEWRQWVEDWKMSGGTSFASVLRLEGDVRLYDWKDISLVDSSTLIEAPGNSGKLSSWLQLDIQSMLSFVNSADPAKYGNIMETTSDGKNYVHGGIALYGGGRNYSSVDFSALDEDLKDFEYLNINISVLAGAEGDLQRQGTLLPKAAGTHDFNFYMYGKDSPNNYVGQLADEADGSKYSGVKHIPLF